MEFISEGIDSIPANKIIDQGDNWLIRDVVLLAEYSKNKGPKGMQRRYPREEQEKALKLFENIHVNCNHPAKRPDGSVDESSRNVLMKLGKVVAPRLSEATQEGRKVSKVIGDVILVKGDAADHIVKLVRLDPKLAGMSITGNLERFDTAEGYENVVGLKPESVDVVHRPATTMSMFESVSETCNVGDATMTKQELLDGSFKTAHEHAEKAYKEAEEATKNAKTLEGQIAAQIKYRAAQQAANKAAALALKDGDHPAFQKLKEQARVCGDAAWAHEGIARAMGGQESINVGSALSEVAFAPGRRKDELEDEDEDEDDLEDDFDDEDEDEDDDFGEDDDDDLEDEDDDDGLDLEDENEDEDEDFEDEEDAEGDNDALTDQANAATADASVRKTVESNMDAAFAHLQAAGMCWQSGNKARAMEHFDRAKEHESAAERLAHLQRMPSRSPMPTPDDKEVGTDSKSKLKTEGLSGVLAVLYEARGSKPHSHHDHGTGKSTHKWVR